jgi:hypothetical protein
MASADAARQAGIQFAKSAEKSARPSRMAEKGMHARYRSEKEERHRQQRDDGNKR